MAYNLTENRENSDRNRKIFEKGAEQWEGELGFHQICFPDIL
jgi:hypothetical protein